VLQVGRRADLYEEPLGADDGRELGLEDLHRDVAPVLEVLGQVHRGHTAGAELAQDAVAVGEGGGQALHGGTHRGTRARSSAVKFCTTTGRDSPPASPIFSIRNRWPSGAGS
jgi:hypothetical protein